MKKWILGILIAILIAGTATNGVLYSQDHSRLKETELRLTKLTGDVQTGINTLDGKISALGQNVTALGKDITSLGNSLSSLSGSVAGLEGNTANLSKDMAGLKTNLSALSGSVSAIESGVNGLKSSVNALENSVAALQAGSRAVLDTVAKLEPSVVRVDVYSLGYWLYGTGMIIRNNGYVLTHYRVVEGALSMQVVLKSGESYKADLMATDPARGLAIIKIVSTRTDFPAVTLGSSSTVKVGEGVIAAGFPLSIDIPLPGQASFTAGIISALRTIDNYAYIQTDAALNRGNDGGPLVNLKGEVIGIIMPKRLDWGLEGAGLAIPIDDAKAFIQKSIGS